MKCIIVVNAGSGAQVIEDMAQVSVWGHVTALGHMGSIIATQNVNQTPFHVAHVMALGELDI